MQTKNTKLFTGFTVRSIDSFSCLFYTDFKLRCEHVKNETEKCILISDENSQKSALFIC